MSSGDQPPSGPWPPPSVPAVPATAAPARRAPAAPAAAIAVLAVVAALILTVVLAVRDDSDQSVVPVAPPSTQGTSPPGRPAALPTSAPTTGLASTSPSTLPPTSSVTATVPKTTTSVTVPATTAPATTTPASAPPTVPVPPTVAPPSATVAAAVPAPSVSGAAVLRTGDESPETLAALENARVLAAALADGDWATARQLGATDRRRTDAQLETSYGPLTDATLVPARVVRFDPWIDLRLGLVAHEAHDNGPATAVMCVHWRVNETTRAVERISSVRLRLEQGTLDPSLLVDELTTTCATYALR